VEIDDFNQGSLTSSFGKESSIPKLQLEFTPRGLDPSKLVSEAVRPRILGFEANHKRQTTLLEQKAKEGLPSEDFPKARPLS
jgi:hypothetical protein